MKNKFNLIIFFFINTYILIGQETGYKYEKRIDSIEKYNLYTYNIEQKKDNFLINIELITPKKKFEKILIIVPGSGKDSKDCHYELTKNLLDNNIGVLRYDERGCGKSQGVYNDLLPIINYMSDDLLFIYNWLKNDIRFNKKKTGIIGHSYGGLFTLKSIEKGLMPDFLILMATPVQKPNEFFKYQIKTGFNKLNDEIKVNTDDIKFQIIDTIFQIIQQNKDLDNKALRKIITQKMDKSRHKKKTYEWFISAPSLLEMLRTDNTVILKEINIPTLYISGTKDIIVDSQTSAINLQNYNNKLINIKLFEDMNHYLHEKELTLENMYHIDMKASDFICKWTNKILN